MKYIARVVSHQEDGLTMLVEFVRPGYTPVSVGCLLPPEGADRQEHLAQYAPIAQWELEDLRRAPKDLPPIGTTFEFTAP